MRDVEGFPCIQSFSILTYDISFSFCLTANQIHRWSRRWFHLYTSRPWPWRWWWRHEHSWWKAGYGSLCHQVSIHFWYVVNVPVCSLILTRDSSKSPYSSSVTCRRTEYPKFSKPPSRLLVSVAQRECWWSTSGNIYRPSQSLSFHCGNLHFSKWSLQCWPCMLWAN